MEQNQLMGSAPTSSSALPGLALEQAPMTKNELQLLEYLFANMGKCVHKERIWVALYSHKPEADWPESEIIKVLVCKLRKKLRHHKITTRFGFGYQLDRLSDPV